MATTRIGIDVGGSGIKAGLVDVDEGRLLAERIRVETPDPATPANVARTVADLVGQIGADGAVGVGFPAVVRGGVVSTAINIAPSWIGVNAIDLFQEALDRRVVVVNDADAAGLAEAAFGAARGVAGTVLILTFGTGVGSALIADGKLMPNLELGQIELFGVRPAELRYSAKARRREDLDWETWGDRANEYLTHVNDLFNPSLMVVGGGIARKWEMFSSRIDPGLPVVPAELGNNAGLVGAAVLAATD